MSYCKDCELFELAKDVKLNRDWDGRCTVMKLRRNAYSYSCYRLQKRTADNILYVKSNPDGNGDMESGRFE